MNGQIEVLRRSRSESDRRQCIALLSVYLETHSDDARAWYDKACCHDFLGEERAAEPCYRRCYELGWQKLPAKEQPSFFVGYGSTLRNNLKYAESISVLKQAVENFPDYPALRVFLAFSLHSNREDRACAEILFSCLQRATQGFDGYERAIQQYVDLLQTVPESRDRDDSLEIVSYDISWPHQFQEIATKLEAALEGLYLSIDHIGSTSVAGLASKRRIDVQITVPALNEDLKSKMDEALVATGFTESRWSHDHKPPGDAGSDEDWTKLYITGVHPGLSFRSNIHVRASGAANQIYPLLFRDYLREHKESAAAYEKLKRELVRFHPNDSIAYTELKDPACDLIMADAGRWAQKTKWQPQLRGLSR
jgi:GrpB-like predicted nucleotidyltransferase (UPF0157 family)